MQVGVTFKLTLIGKIMDKDISEHFSDYCKSWLSYWSIAGWNCISPHKNTENTISNLRKAGYSSH